MRRLASELTKTSYIVELAWGRAEGLLAEEYHPELGRQLGNFPQAFSRIGLINTAHLIEEKRARRAVSFPAMAQLH